MSIHDDREAMRKLALKAQDVAKDETKTAAEKMAELDQIQVDIKAKADSIDVAQKAAKFQDMVGSVAPAEESKALVKAYGSPAEEFVASKAFEEAAGKAARNESFAVGMTVGLKAAGNIAEGSTVSGGFLSGNAGAAVLPNYLPGVVPIKYAPLAVAQLFSQASTDSPLISYVKQSAETIAAAGVSEGGAKPYADTTLTRVNEQVGKVAVLEKITDEFIKDAPGLQSWLQNLLVAQVQRFEDDAVLNGTGYPSVSGILGRTGLQTAVAVGTAGATTGQEVIEAVMNQITNIRFNAFMEPDALVFNPTDWQKIRLTKDANNQYLGGGPFTGAYGNGGFTNVESLWGFRAVVTPRIAAGTVLVGDFSSSTLFRRQGITVEMTNSNGTDFENNLVTVRVESRLALMAQYPGAFGTVAITW